MNIFIHKFITIFIKHKILFELYFLTTPPASVAFNTTSTSNFPNSNLLILLATTALAAMLKYVLIIALDYDPKHYNAALKLGQYMNRKMVPKKAVRLWL